MLDCQHIRPIGTDENPLFFYTRLSPQPLSIRFDFLPKHTHRSSVGNVRFFINVAGREYGPYVTSIVTTTNVWNNRKGLRPGKSAQTVNALVKAVNDLLVKSWYSLLNQNIPITGEMILQTAGLVEKEVSNA